MNKTGVLFLCLIVGLAAGVLVGYVLFHGNQAEPSNPTVQQAGMPDVHQYFYRLNDSLVSRHTVSVTDSGLSHHIDTVAIQRR